MWCLETFGWLIAWWLSPYHLTPCRLQGFDPPIARRFARRQLELMGQGMPKHEARDMAEVSAPPPYPFNG